MDEFAGKVALVTGAGRDIGREVALAFASLGVIVAANDINPINVDETVQQIKLSGGNARPYVFDIAKRMPIEAMVTQVVDHFDRLDFLVNAAFVDPVASILEMDEWEFHRTLDVNLSGPFFCIQLAGRVMRQLGGGVMVNLVTADHPGNAGNGHAARTASQAGLVGMTEVVAAELSAFNIRLNTICYPQPELKPVNMLPWDPADLQKWRAGYPNLHLGEHPDLACLVLFLCSEAARDLTGQVL
ncbi:MAG TPA: SDR family oxidoreductase [Anaerolineales bacterium]